MACKVALYNVIDKLIANKPYISFNKEHGVIDVKNSVTNRINNNNRAAITYSFANQFNKKIKDLIKDKTLGDILYVNWENNVPYILVGPTDRQLNIINNQLSNNTSEVVKKDFEKEKFLRETALRQKRANEYIDDVGDVYPTLQDAIAASNRKEIENNVNNFITLEEAEQAIKDLYENPELANSVYEALGFKILPKKGTKEYRDAEDILELEIMLEELGNEKLRGNFKFQDILLKADRTKGFTDKYVGWRKYFNVVTDMDTMIGIYGYVNEKEGYTQSEDTLQQLLQLIKNHVNEFKIEGITPQQKQQALQLYSQYLQQNPNSSVEQFKSWVEEFNKNNQKLNSNIQIFSDNKQGAFDSSSLKDDDLALMLFNQALGTNLTSINQLNWDNVKDNIFFEKEDGSLGVKNLAFTSGNLLSTKKATLNDFINQKGLFPKYRVFIGESVIYPNVFEVFENEDNVIKQAVFDNLFNLSGAFEQVKKELNNHSPETFIIETPNGEFTFPKRFAAGFWNIARKVELLLKENQSSYIQDYLANKEKREEVIKDDKKIKPVISQTLTVNDVIVQNAIGLIGNPIIENAIKNNTSVKIQVFSNAEYSEDGLAGWYLPASNTIYLHESMLNPKHLSEGLPLIAHELIHSVTEQALQFDKNFQKDIQSLLDSVKNQSQIKDFYGFKNTSEFLSEAFSSKEFRELLNTTKFSNTEKISVWQKFINSILRLFGKSVKYTEKTNITNAEQILNNLINQHSYKIGYVKSTISDKLNTNISLSDFISQKSQENNSFQQFQQSLNNPNTNPILQGNQQEQIKKFAELQERLNNKEFLEGAKNAFESSEELQNVYYETLGIEQYSEIELKPYATDVWGKVPKQRGDNNFVNKEQYSIKINTENKGIDVRLTIYFDDSNKTAFVSNIENFENDVTHPLKKGLGLKAFLEANRLITKRGYTPVIDNLVSGYGYDMMLKLEKQGYLSKVLNKNISNSQYDNIKYENPPFVFTNKIYEIQITPQQKQDALNAYTDYIARVSLGIIKNPSSGEYNYESQVKDIVYHGTSKIARENILKEGFKEPIDEELEDMQDSLIWFSKDKYYYYKKEDKNIVSIPSLVNIKSPNIDSHENFLAYGDASGIKAYNLSGDGLITQEEDAGDFMMERAAEKYFSEYGKYPDNYNPNTSSNLVFTAVPTAKQIHILGSKQDIEGFKDFVNRQNNTTPLVNVNIDLENKPITKNDIINSDVFHELITQMVSNNEINKNCK